MPHLSPMNWLIIMTVSLLFLILLMTSMWWHSPISINKHNQTSTRTQIPSWKWHSQ